MCGRVVVDYEGMAIGAADREIARWVATGLARRSRTEPVPSSSWNLAPTQQIPVLVRPPASPGDHRVELARWGIVPPWENEFSTRYPTFNARIERVAERPTFAPSLAARRCAVLTTGYYEWQTIGKRKIPHIIGGPGLLPLAGLYSWWREPGVTEGAGWRLTATVLTREARGPLAAIHHRMPVFLGDDLAESWLDPQIRADDGLLEAISDRAATIAQGLSPIAVAPLRGDGPDLIQPQFTP